MDSQLVSEILDIVLALVAMYLGSKYKRAKRILADVAKTVEDINKSLEDNEVTPDEIKKITQDLKRLLSDF